jgi:LPXTG-motif cell wall-anchored protein
MERNVRIRGKLEYQGKKGDIEFKAIQSQKLIAYTNAVAANGTTYGKVDCFCDKYDYRLKWDPATKKFSYSYAVVAPGPSREQQSRWADWFLGTIVRANYYVYGIALEELLNDRGLSADLRKGKGEDRAVLDFRFVRSIEDKPSEYLRQASVTLDTANGCEIIEYTLEIRTRDGKSSRANGSVHYSDRDSYPRFPTRVEYTDSNVGQWTKFVRNDLALSELTEESFHPRAFGLETLPELAKPTTGAITRRWGFAIAALLLGGVSLIRWRRKREAEVESR